MDKSALMMDGPAHEASVGDTPQRVLIIEIDDCQHRWLDALLRQGFGAKCMMHWIRTVDDDKAKFTANAYDLAIVMDGGTGERGLESIRQVRTIDTKLPIILVSHAPSRVIADETIDCIDFDELTPPLLKAVSLYLRERQRADRELETNHDLSEGLASTQRKLAAARHDTPGVERLIRRLAENNPLGSWYQAADGRTKFLNSKAAEILEIPQDPDRMPYIFEALVAPAERNRLADIQTAWRNGESRQFECRMIGPRSGREKLLLVSGTPISSPGERDGGVLISFLDNSEREQSAATIERLSHHDTLTGLPNRDLFQDRLKQAMAFAERGRKHNALLVLDLDRFKDINDTWGHRAGDQLLQMVATRLMQCTRQMDTVARLGGNEFAIVCTELDHGDLVQHVAERVIDAMARPFEIDGKTINTSSTIGIALFPFDTDDADQLIKFADLALSQAKLAGRNHYQFFDVGMDEAVRRRKGLEVDLRRAIETEAFTLFYQPQLRLGDGVVYGAEALVRWNHPERGMVSPADFIPLAESTGLIRELGHWVLRTACKQASAWAKAGHPDIRMAVNLSAVEFMSDNLLGNVRAALEESGLPPQQLELEITESAVMEDMEKAIATMRELRKIGARLAIDDFGTGFSSLSYLKRFPVQALKIDRSFVQEILLSSEDAAIASAVISLGKSLNLEVIAEGVEEAEQADHLRQAGCPFAQGYFFGRPVPADEFFA